MVPDEYVCVEITIVESVPRPRKFCKLFLESLMGGIGHLLTLPNIVPLTLPETICGFNAGWLNGTSGTKGSGTHNAIIRSSSW